MAIVPFPQYADINKFGDIVCPFCQLQMITPSGMTIKEGTGKCISCGKTFKVSKENAELANQRQKET